jgi:prepilin-type N-terminal cleavage/methylation domain-containing protein
MNRRGFTLIEVLISLFILVLIGFTTSKAVVDAANLKEILKGETEFSSEVRTSISFIERDLSQIFNPRWFLPPNQRAMDPFAQPTPAPAGGGAAGANSNIRKALSPDDLNRFLQGMAFQSFEYWGPVYDSSGIRPSRFKGTENSMQFVSASHYRIYAQKKESIYAKIKYEVVRQPPNPNLTKTENEKLAGLFQLVKIENTRAFELEEKRDSPHENVYVILNNIKKLRFGYFKPETKDPVREWDSDRQEQRGVFPEAVEMEFSLAAPNDRTLDATVLFKLEAPNHVLPATY